MIISERPLATGGGVSRNLKMERPPAIISSLRFEGVTGTFLAFMELETTSASRLYDFLAWLDANKKRLGVAAGVVVLAVFVLALVIWQGNQREFKANEALSNVQPAGNSARGSDTVPAAAYLKVSADFAGTSAGARATLMGAFALFAEGKYAEAQAQFGKFQPEYPDSPLVPQSILGIAASLDAQGKFADAAAKYQEVIARFPRDYSIGQAKLALALNHENRKLPEAAYKIYNELMQGAGNSSAGSEARMRLGELLTKYPNLAPTNAPVAGPLKP